MIRFFSLYLLAATGGNPQPPGLRVYFNHHRVGTLSISGVLRARSVAGMLPRRFANVAAGELPDWEIPSGLVCIFNARVEDQRRLMDRADARAVHVVRDPRAIALSSYFSHRNSHPLFEGLKEHRARLASAPFEEGFFLDVEWSEQRFGTMNTLADWDQTCPSVLEVRLEELVESPAPTWRRIFKFLNLPMPWPLAHVLLRGFTTERLREHRKKLGLDPDHYRAAGVQSWREMLTPEMLSEFEGRYGKVIERWAYELASRATTPTRLNSAVL